MANGGGAVKKLLVITAVLILLLSVISCAENPQPQAPSWQYQPPPTQTAPTKQQPQQQDVYEKNLTPDEEMIQQQQEKSSLEERQKKEQIAQQQQLDELDFQKMLNYYEQLSQSIREKEAQFISKYEQWELSKGPLHQRWEHYVELLIKDMEDRWNNVRGSEYDSADRFNEQLSPDVTQFFATQKELWFSSIELEQLCRDAAHTVTAIGKRIEELARIYYSDLLEARSEAEVYYEKEQQYWEKAAYYQNLEYPIKNYYLFSDEIK